MAFLKEQLTMENLNTLWLQLSLVRETLAEPSGNDFTGDDIYCTEHQPGGNYAELLHTIAQFPLELRISQATMLIQQARDGQLDDETVTLYLEELNVPSQGKVFQGGSF